MATRSRPNRRRIRRTNDAFPRFVMPIRQRTENRNAGRAAEETALSNLANGGYRAVAEARGDLWPLSSNTCVAYGEER